VLGRTNPMFVTSKEVRDVMTNSHPGGLDSIGVRLAESFGPDAQEQIFRRSAMAAYRLEWQ